MPDDSIADGWAQDPAAVLGWLGGPAGGALLTDADRVVAGGASALAIPDLLARRHPDVPRAGVTAALGQVDLRARAATRFGPDAARMLFTREGLEQATRRAVADHRAASLVRRSAGAVHTVADLCCGIGGDLLALARAGFAVTGVDLDPVAVSAARANVAALGLTATVELADVTAVDRSRFDAVVADPARRSGRGREADPASFSPDWEWVRALLTGADAGAGVGARACVTTTPALPHRLVPGGCEAEWVGHDGDTVEAALWSPALSGRTRRRATLLDAGGVVRLSVTDADLPGGAPPVRDPVPGDVLLDPAGPVVRAGLVGVLTARVGGALTAPGLAYVLAAATPAPADSALAAAFQVREVLPVRDRVLRDRLRTLDVGRLEILVRGVDVRPEALRNRLLGTRPRGSAAATIVLTRTTSGAAALLVDRLP